MDRWALEACSGGSGEVVNWLVVGSRVHHGSGSVTTTGSVKGCVGAWDLACVKSGGREVVLGHVEDFGFEDFSCLLSDSLSQKLIVHLDSRHVTSVAWDDCCFPLTWAFRLHVVVRSPVEVVGCPCKEFLFVELLGGTVVREAKLRVLFEHFR